MNPKDTITALAQSVYLVIKNRYYDDIESEDGQVYIEQILDWGNQWLEELDTMTDGVGNVVNWTWVRRIGFTLGTAQVDSYSIPFPSKANNLIVEEGRYVQVVHDGAVVSNWAVVDPGAISNNGITEDMVTRVGDTLVFSRPFRDTESGGTIIGDVTVPFKPLSLTSADSIKVVKPRQLMVLGIAKNATLPDIVRGSLSPTYLSRYNKLLADTIARNNVGSVAHSIERQQFGGIGGI